MWRDSQKIVGPVDLQLFPREIKGIFGLNGCGKSTLLRAAGGILRSGIRGSIKWFGRDSLAAAPQLMRRIGQQIQSFPVVPTLSVAEQLRLVCQLRSQSQISTSADLQRIFDRLPELYPKRNERADQLNGGSTTMLSVALAMVGLRHGLLLLDEPTNNLSVSAADMLRNAILDSVHHDQNAVLVVSHDREWLGGLMPPKQILSLSEPRTTRDRWKKSPTTQSTVGSGPLATRHQECPLFDEETQRRFSPQATNPAFSKASASNFASLRSQDLP